MPIKTGCGGCAGPLIIGGYFLAARPSDLDRLVFYSGTLQEIELAFDLPVAAKSSLEKRLLALHAECGCTAASIAIVLGVIVLVVGRYYFDANPSLAGSVIACLGIAVSTKVLWIAIARLRIVIMARRLSKLYEERTFNNA
jgi:hypothetical protein